MLNVLHYLGFPSHLSKTFLYAGGHHRQSLIRANYNIGSAKSARWAPRHVFNSFEQYEQLEREIRAVSQGMYMRQYFQE